MQLDYSCNAGLLSNLMLILTEKSSVAKDIAAALGGYAFQKDGFYLNGNNCIVFAAGHLLELFAPDDYDPKYKNWNKEDLPIIPKRMNYKPIPSGKERLSCIKKCFNAYAQNGFILATDPEREGELIGALILNYVHFTDYQNARRFWVAEALTPDVVHKGINNAKLLAFYDPYKKAGYARQQADWLIGMNLTRFMTVSLGGTLFSVGRVQTAVLGAIYLRDKSIKNFVPVPYIMLRIDCGNFSLFLTDQAKNQKFSSGDKYLADAYTAITQDSTVSIKTVDAQHKIEQPPQLFNITGLQKYCSQKFKYSPKKTLEIVQNLYEKLKCMSYPRTPSVVLGDDNVSLYKSKYGMLSKEYPEFAKGCDTEKICAENKRLFNSARLTDHHALIPLDVLPEAAAEEQRNVYYAVLERFFTVIKPAFEYSAVSITGDCEGCLLTGTGRKIIAAGWKQREDNNDDEDADEQVISDITEGSVYPVVKKERLEKQTMPKKHFTEATLLALMENPTNEEGEHLAGLGTPATRADIIDTLLQRSYIGKQKQNLLIAEKGCCLIDSIIKIPALADFISIRTTTKWEQQLEDKPDDFLNGIKKFLTENLPSMSVSGEWKGDALGICPSCGKGRILSGKKSYFCSEWKEGCRFTIWRDCCGAAITDNDVKTLLSGGKTRAKKMKTKAGKEFSAPLQLCKTEKDWQIKFAFNKK
jgi:DNA topoisomerase III